MYLKRKLDAFLSQWYLQDKRLPLIIKGARQIGKTETIRHFAHAHYQNIIEINFIEEPKYKRIVDEGYHTEDILAALSRINPRISFPSNTRTLLFFDEIQAFPDIATALKFFAQSSICDVICSGSLLGIHYREISSVSVGYKQDIDMHSLDFEEFLWARGYDDDLVEELLGAMRLRQPLRDATFSTLKGLFLDYSSLGGMPAIVRTYIERKSFEGVLSAQQQLVRDYRDDIRKYADSLDKERIISVFNHIPTQLANEKTIKFQISKVAHGARAREYAPCVNWLVDAGVANICHCLRTPSLPLSGNYSDDKYRLFMGDVGVLMGMMDPQTGNDIRVNRNLGIWKGALYEDIVSEALVKSDQKLFYWKRDESKLEMDFFLRKDSSLIPLEVKGGNDATKSLNEMIASPNYPGITWGIKLANANIGFSNGKLTLPWFCAFLLSRLLATGDTKPTQGMGWFEPAKSPLLEAAER